MGRNKNKPNQTNVKSEIEEIPGLVEPAIEKPGELIPIKADPDVLPLIPLVNEVSNIDENEKRRRRIVLGFRA